MDPKVLKHRIKRSQYELPHEFNDNNEKSSKKEAESSIPLLFLVIRSSQGQISAPSLEEGTAFLRQIMERNLESKEEDVFHLSWWNYLDASCEKFALAVSDLHSYNQLLDWIKTKDKYLLLSKDTFKEVFKTKELPSSVWKVVLPSLFVQQFTAKHVIDAIVKQHGFKGDFFVHNNEKDATEEETNDPRSEWTLHLNLDIRAELEISYFSVKGKDGRVKTVIPLAGFPTFWRRMVVKNN